MNNERHDSIGEAMHQAQPPHVFDAEWDAVWRGMAAKARSAPSRGGLVRRLAFAATFAVGMLIGGLGTTFIKDSSPIDSNLNDRVENSDGLNHQVAQEERGIELLGLHDVEINNAGVDEDGVKNYKLTGKTPSGIDVVWVYPDIKSAH
jgi:hypothetical protein